MSDNYHCMNSYSYCWSTAFAESRKRWQVQEKKRSKAHQQNRDPNCTSPESPDRQFYDIADNIMMPPNKSAAARRPRSLVFLLPLRLGKNK